MDVTSILNGFAGGKMDKNTLNALAGCCSGNNGANSPIIWIILLLLFWNGGFGGNNNCGGNNGNTCCGNYNVNPYAPYYTYYDPCCCCESSKKSKKESDLYYMQPVGYNYCMPQNCNNNCNNGCNNSWWIWIIILLLFTGLGNNGGCFGNKSSCSATAAASATRVKEDNYDSCDEVDFTD